MNQRRMLPDSPDAALSLPDGYRAVDLGPSSADLPLRLCMVVRPAGDPALGHFVVLRDTLDARVYLGCICDHRGRLHEWVEVWVQHVGPDAQPADERHEPLTNTVLDQRWTTLVESISRSSPDTLIASGWEESAPPLYFDAASLTFRRPIDAAGTVLGLCRDDNLLTGRGLPAYSGSAHRYLRLAGGEQLVPVTAEAPTNEQTSYLGQAAPGFDVLFPFNPACGRMLVRRHASLTLDGYLKMLTSGSAEGTMPAPLQESQSTNGKVNTGWLMLGRHGRWGRLIETLHLKLRALADAVDAVESALRFGARPLLNLSTDSFRVDLLPQSRGLPRLWTARTTLVDAGSAVALAVPDSDVRYYVPARKASSPVFSPAAMLGMRGRGAVRIRRVLPEVNGATVLEGTVASQDKLEVGRQDLVWFRMGMGAGPVDLYARLEPDSALAAGEWRFRTVARRLNPDAAAQLRAAEGVPFNSVSFILLPMLSSCCDLYGMGVLAIRTLLTNSATSLPLAVDAVMSLARQVSHDGAASDDLPAAVGRVVSGERKWLDLLGPQRLTDEEISIDEALDLVPQQVWWGVLAMVLRMIPGAGPFAHCQDLSDAPPDRPQAVFERAAADLQELIFKTRSLMFIDWRFNREVHAVVRSFQSGLHEAAPSQGAGGEPVGATRSRGAVPRTTAQAGKK